MKTGRWARILCGVGCGLAFVLAMFMFIGGSMAGEPGDELPVRLAVLSTMFLAAAVIAFVATVWMKTSPRAGGVLALVAALVCLPSVFLEGLGLDALTFMGVMWLIPGAPLLIASALAFRAARRMGSG